jgi:signal transduction histidine kinase
VSGLYAWLRRHPRLVDGMLALPLLVLGAGVPTVMTVNLAVRVPFILGSVAPVVFRRQHPGWAFAAIIAVGGLQVLLLPRPIGSDVSVLIMLYTLAACRPRRVSLCGLAVCLAGAAVAAVRWQPQRPGLTLYGFGVDLAVFGAPVLLAWVLGDSARWRRGYYQALEERASRLERERDAQAQVAAAAERARIARDMHDVVAHNLTVMVVQADGAAFALDTSPQQARQALSAISATGRRALAEMRSLLGVLRDSADPASLAPASLAPASLAPASLAPQPGLEQLDELLDQARAAGLPVSCTISGAPRAVPAGEALAAYRVVQESLTNIRKHAGPGVTAAVRLSYSGRHLVIRVTDDGRGAAVPVGAAPLELAGAKGPGHGLAGMGERIGLYGGTVRSGPRTGGGYEVVAELPLALADQ